MTPGGLVAQCEKGCCVDDWILKTKEKGKKGATEQ